MAVKPKQYFIDKFVTGYVVKQSDWEEFFESFRHISESVDISDISQIETLLAGYRSSNVPVPIGDVDGFSSALSAELNNYWRKNEVIPLDNLPGFSQAVDDAIAAAISGGNIYIDTNVTISAATHNLKHVLVAEDVEITIPTGIAAGVNVTFDCAAGCTFIAPSTATGDIDGLNDPDAPNTYRVLPNGRVHLATFDDGTGVSIRLGGDFV